MSKRPRRSGGWGNCEERLREEDYILLSPSQLSRKAILIISGA
jgi:hypothetical protein